MLTQKEIAEVARLREQVGDLRPGFLQDGAGRLAGPTPAHASPAAAKRRKRRTRSASGSARVNFRYEVDRKTGGMHIVSK
jgi:hypothetical protein